MHKHPARHALRALVLCLIAYSLLCGLMFAYQRSILFQPFPGPLTPAEARLDAYVPQTLPQAGDAPSIRYWFAKGIPHAPLVVYFHGNGGGLHAFTGALAQLHAQGYSVAAMEYRGYPGAGGTPSEQGIISDAIRFTHAMHTRYPALPLILWGYSLGSGIATQVAAASDEESAMVLEAPFTSVKDRAAELWPILPIRLLLRDPFLSIDHIAQSKSPLFIMHGDTDRIIPLHHGERLFAAAQQPKIFYRAEGADHYTLATHGGYDAAYRFIALYTGRNAPHPPHE